MGNDTLAFVGAAGGTGTTRLVLECGTLLARNGIDVAILDAAYETQGLADRTPGRIDPDVTALCLDDDPLEAGLVDRTVEGAGRLAVCPARAPFERLARAKSPEAASALADRIQEADRAFEYVLVDTPPVAANQAVAAVTATDRVAVVADADRASDTVPRTTDRLADVGVGDAVTVVTRAETHPDAVAAIPKFESETPAVATDRDARAAVASVIEATLSVSLDVDNDEGLRSKLPM